MTHPAARRGVRVRVHATAVTATRTTEPTPTPADARSRAFPPWPELPGFEILAELGRGGMGVVYKARQKGLNRTVALKMIGPGAAANPDLLSRFRSEAEVIARLQQPNIIQVYEIGTSPAGPYFAMEHAEGGSLAERWGGVPQPARATAQTVLALALAVQAAHEQGIIHRDLKPANILLALVSGSQNAGKNAKLPSTDGGRHADRDLVPKISDFGLARRLDDTRDLTVTGQVMGTPGYMAPEQARGGGDDVGPATDVYALGVLLYEALTGMPPYRGASGLESVHLMLSGGAAVAVAVAAGPAARPRQPSASTVCTGAPQAAHATAAAAVRRPRAVPRRRADQGPADAGVGYALEVVAASPTAAGLAGALVLLVTVAFALVLGQWRRAEEERVLTEGAQ